MHSPACSRPAFLDCSSLADIGDAPFRFLRTHLARRKMSAFPRTPLRQNSFRPWGFPCCQAGTLPPRIQPRLLETPLSARVWLSTIFRGRILLAGIFVLPEKTEPTLRSSEWSRTY